MCEYKFFTIPPFDMLKEGQPFIRITQLSLCTLSLFLSLSLFDYYYFLTFFFFFFLLLFFSFSFLTFFPS